MNAEQILKLQGERAALIKRMRDLLDKADGESRSPTVEEQQEYSRMEADVEAMGARIKLERQQLQREQELDELDVEELDPRQAQRAESARTEAEERSAEYADVFEKYARFGIGELDHDERKILRLGYRAMPTGDGGWEGRDQSVGTTTAGGFLVPTGFQRVLYEHLVQAGTMRMTRATHLVTSSGETMQFPKTTAHGAANWVSEAGAITGTDEEVGQIELSAYKAVRLVKCSIEILEDNAVDLEAYLGREIGRSIGALENAAFVDGNGSGRPNGIVGTATLGKAGATGQTSTVTADDLMDLFYSVAPPYRRDGEWMLKDDTLKAVMKLKDADGKYLFASGLTGYGVQTPTLGTLLGRPVHDDPDMPAMAASAKSILFGDFSAYLIRDVGRPGPTPGEKGESAFFVRRLDERYADNLQVGFLSWHRTDGDLLDLTGAVKYYQNAAS